MAALKESLSQWKAAPGVLVRDECSMIPPVGHPRRAKYEQCVREAGKVLADAFDTGRFEVHAEAA